MTNQSGIHESLLSIAGLTSATFNEALIAANLANGGTATTCNGAWIELLQSATGSTDAEINGLKTLYASQKGFPDWNSVSSFEVTAVNPLRVVSLYNAIHSGVVSMTSLDRLFRRRPHILCSNTDAIVLRFDNWYVNTAGLGTMPNGVGDYTVEGVWIEDFSGTVKYPLTFDGGSSTKTIVAGASDILTDPISASVFSLAEFSATESYWVSALYSTSAASLPQSTISTASTGTGSQTVRWNTATTTTSNPSLPGQLTVASGTAFSTGSFGPDPVMLGRPATSDPAFVALGDSITQGTGDTSTTVRYGPGWFQRSLGTAALTPRYAGLNLAVASTRGSLWSGNTKWHDYIKYCRFGVIAPGRNDIVSDGASLATLQTRDTSIWSTLRANGIEKIVRAKLIPDTTSTDTWQTTANQTPRTNMTAAGTAGQFNDWLDTQSPSLIDLVLQHTSIRDSGDPYKWVVTGATNYATSDGTHPGGTGHGIMAGDGRTALTSVI